MIKELLKDKIIEYYKAIKIQDSYDDLYNMSLNTLITDYINIYNLSIDDFKKYLLSYLGLSNVNFSWEDEEFLNLLYSTEVLNPLDITLCFIKYYNDLVDDKEREYAEIEDEIMNSKNWAQKKALEEDNRYTINQITKYIAELDKVRKSYQSYLDIKNSEEETRRM